MPKRLCLYLTDERLESLGPEPTKRILELIDAQAGTRKPAPRTAAPARDRWVCDNCGSTNFGGLECRKCKVER